MITYYPSPLQQSSSFAISSSTALTATNTPDTASFAEYSSGNPGPTGPTLIVNALFNYGA